ncbi:hypothetical protein TIFTF001_006845 [Ficus carica]|uniref:Uncharacterized protein n=1 Tax=Ficus carica TaxID=3494 RepID=A0AA88DG28_FICCA|nr:hypothetical protein TIFTF001_006845 [Ficus carica]
MSGRSKRFHASTCKPCEAITFRCELGEMELQPSRANFAIDYKVKEALPRHHQVHHRP